MQKCLTKDSNVVSSDEESIVNNIGLSTPLYTLSVDKKEEVLSPSSWLSDTVIEVALPHLAGIPSHIWPARSSSSPESVFPSSQRRLCADRHCWRLSLVYCFQHRM